MRSGPSSLGLSMFTFKPVLTPGPTTKTSLDENLFIADTTLSVIWGTTEQTIAP